MPAQRKAKAQELLRLAKELDLQAEMEQHLAIRMIRAATDAECTELRKLNTYGLEFFTLLSNMANEGPLDYGGTGNDQS